MATAESTAERRFSEDAADLAASIGSVRTRSLSPPPKGWKARFGLGGVARRTLGFGLLMVTVFLWTLSNFLASVGDGMNHLER
jgi:solute carrier family 35 protein F5